MELELEEKSTMSREDAARRLQTIADELASGNDIIMERGQGRFVAKVPHEIALKIEFEVGSPNSSRSLVRDLLGTPTLAKQLTHRLGQNSVDSKPSLPRLQCASSGGLLGMVRAIPTILS